MDDWPGVPVARQRNDTRGLCERITFSNFTQMFAGWKVEDERIPPAPPLDAPGALIVVVIA